jgi:hypothetical protein
MATVRVRDQYGAEHDVSESQLAYEPWRSCEVITPEDDQPEPGEAPKAPQPPSQPDTKPISKKAAFRPASEDKE